jgi:hypothetical protein
MVLAARPTLAEVPLADRSFATDSTIYAATSGGFSMFRRRRAR